MQPDGTLVSIERLFKIELVFEIKTKLGLKFDLEPDDFESWL